LFLVFVSYFVIFIWNEEAKSLRIIDIELLHYIACFTVPFLVVMCLSVQIINKEKDAENSENGEADEKAVAKS